MCIDYKDQIKTAFITPYGAYCYKIKSFFGLKNAGATYQRAIQLCFTNQLHRNVEAYMDDVVYKTKNPKDFIKDLQETFDSLRKFRWKLNPTKWVFGVLRFSISNRGIEANPKKSYCHHCNGTSINHQGCSETQRVHGGTQQIHLQTWRTRTPLLQATQKTGKFQWAKETNAALEDLKHHLESPPILTAPTEGENLLLYIAATTHVVTELEGSLSINSKTSICYPHDF